ETTGLEKIFLLTVRHRAGSSNSGERMIICALSGLTGLGTKIRETLMFKKTTFAAALLAATVMSGMASAKTFVYCSEASPEGFDPGLYTAGTTFDAAAHTVYNRLL